MLSKEAIMAKKYRVTLTVEERDGLERVDPPRSGRATPYGASADVVWMKSVWHLPRDEAPLCS